MLKEKYLDLKWLQFILLIISNQIGAGVNSYIPNLD